MVQLLVRVVLQVMQLVVEEVLVVVLVVLVEDMAVHDQLFWSSLQITYLSLSFYKVYEIA